jgi:hypothetical protein
MFNFSFATSKLFISDNLDSRKHINSVLFLAKHLHLRSEDVDFRWHHKYCISVPD